MKKIVLLLFLISVTSVSAADLKLVSDKSKILVGDKLSVKIFLSGSEETLGSDVILLFDPQVLNAETITPSKLYPTYNPAGKSRIDTVKGKILLSGSAGIGKSVAALGEFATIDFKALKPGSTSLKFDYEKGSTTKTGVVSPSGKELLVSQPNALSINVAYPSFIQKLVMWFNNLFKKK